MIPSIRPEKLTVQRDALLVEVQTNEDWVLLNSMGALPEGLEYSLTHEKINEGIISEGEEINVFIRHRTIGNAPQENGTCITFERPDDLPEDKSQWPSEQEASLFEDAWGTGYAEQQTLIAEVVCLQKIKNAL